MWAAEHRIVSVGPYAGLQWTNEMAPYLVEILDFGANPWARRAVVRKSSRIGYTEGVIGNLIGYTIDQDPCTIAVLQPSDGEAEGYSKEQITPMLEENPRIRERLGAMNARRSDATMTFMRFAGGYLLLLGSASDKNLRRRSIRRAIADEIDGMKVDGTEGDPILRFQKRTDDYEDGYVLMGSTPTVKGRSRIDREFERSDKRFWHVPCPHCDEFQVLRWGGPDKRYGIKWDRELYCKACGAESESGVGCACGGKEFDARHLYHTAHYVCEFCGESIDEQHKPAMVRAGAFIATQPESNIPGWHIDALVSLFVGARWPKLVEEWIDAQDDVDDLKVFVNTVLGEAWEERGQKVHVSALEARAEEYENAKREVVDVPDGVGILTAFVDVQGSWFELLVRGWGVGRESWDILHERVYGDPELETTQARLLALLTKSYRHELGTDMRIMWTFVDAGAYTDMVYAFVRGLEHLNVFASLGDKTGAPDADSLRIPARANSRGVRVFTIGTFKMKDRLFRWLRTARPGPKYMHLRAYNPERCNGFDPNYYRQFESEKRVMRKKKRMYIQTMTRNETVDCHVGNFAALEALGAGGLANMEAWVEAARTPTPATIAESSEGESDTGWINQW